MNGVSGDQKQPAMYAGYQGQPPAGAYQGQPQGGPYPGQAPAGAYQGQPQAGPYPGQAPMGAYQGQPQAGPYPGQAPAGAYQGQPQAGAYQGQPQAGPYPGQAPAGAYQGQPQAGAYQGQPAAAAYQGQPPAGAYQGPPPAAGAVESKWTGDVHHEDVADDPNRQAPPPSAPGADLIEKLPGYENVGFQSGGFLPPPAYDDTPQAPPNRSDIGNLPRITEDAVKEALLQFVSEHCCYGKKAAVESRIIEMQHSSAFHYTLETFTETRATAWVSVPFVGQPIDGPHNGPAPGPWDIGATAPAKFGDATIQVEVPHTASVKPCHDCLAMGYKRCYRCLGRGRVRCGSCGGSGRQTRYIDGRTEYENCTWCYGSGRQRCSTCSGDGRITCHTCKGRAQLKWFIQLTIQWKNNVNDHVVERTSLPAELVRTVTGQLAFEEEAPRVFPINHFPDPSVNAASNQIVNSHATSFQLSRILAQRHRVRIVPVCQCQAQFKDKAFQFHVYGFENRVHGPDYPQKCCWGCTVL